VDGILVLDSLHINKITSPMYLTTLLLLYFAVILLYFAVTGHFKTQWVCVCVCVCVCVYSISLVMLHNLEALFDIETLHNCQLNLVSVKTFVIFFIFALTEC
jgi:hypothetical protein